MLEKSSFSLFPSTALAAYYDPFHQIICINSYEEKDFKGVNFSDYSYENVDKISLFEHEFTHWLDHVSTLWGQENLIRFFNALNSKVTNNVNEFWRIKDYIDSNSSDKFNRYYTEKYNHIHGTKETPWRQGLSMGMRFGSNGNLNEERSILLMRFSAFDKTPVIRVPITVSSILETNAINAEYMAKIAVASKLEKDEFLVELAMLETELITLLYNPDFALYSVNAHLTSLHSKSADIVETYRISSELGTLILNLPRSRMKELPTKHITDPELINRYNNLKTEGNRGGVFNLLLANYTNDQKGDFNYDIDEILKSSDLPNKEDLQAEVLEEMKSSTSELIEGPFKSMAIDYLELGANLFRERGILGNEVSFREYLIENKISPTLIFGDTILNLDEVKDTNSLEKLEANEHLTVEEKYSLLDFFENKFNEFEAICGI